MVTSRPTPPNSGVRLGISKRAMSAEAYPAPRRSGGPGRPRTRCRVVGANRAQAAAGRPTRARQRKADGSAAEPLRAAANQPARRRRARRPPRASGKRVGARRGSGRAPADPERAPAAAARAAAEAAADTAPNVHTKGTNSCPFSLRTRWTRATSGIRRDSPHTTDHPDFTAPPGRYGHSSPAGGDPVRALLTARRHRLSAECVCRS
jgi:hypothetical protein